MDLTLFNGRLNGLPGVMKAILDAALQDRRWGIYTVGWDANAETRVIRLRYHDAANGWPLGEIEVLIKERLFDEPG